MWLISIESFYRFNLSNTRRMYNYYSCTWTTYWYTFNSFLFCLHDLSVTSDRCGEAYIKTPTTATITNSKRSISITNKPTFTQPYLSSHFTNKNDFYISLQVINPLINTVKIENSFLVLNVIQLSTGSIVCWWLFCFTQFW